MFVRAGMSSLSCLVLVGVGSCGCRHRGRCLGCGWVNIVWGWQGLVVPCEIVWVSYVWYVFVIIVFPICLG